MSASTAAFGHLLSSRRQTREFTFGSTKDSLSSPQLTDAIRLFRHGPNSPMDFSKLVKETPFKTRSIL